MIIIIIIIILVSVHMVSVYGFGVGFRCMISVHDFGGVISSVNGGKAKKGGKENKLNE